MASAFALGSAGWATPLRAMDAAAGAGSVIDPDTLFLTWQRDPTTTMTLQWVGPEAPADTKIHYRPLSGSTSLTTTPRGTLSRLCGRWTRMLA